LLRFLTVTQQTGNLWSKYHTAPIVGSETEEIRLRGIVRSDVFMVIALIIFKAM
jgi:hypothetical protein